MKGIFSTHGLKNTVSPSIHTSVLLKTWLIPVPIQQQLEMNLLETTLSVVSETMPSLSACCVR